MLTMNNRRGAERRKQVQKRRAAVYGLIPWAVILLNLFLLFRMRGELDALSREMESIRELLSGSVGAVRTESVPVNVSGGAETDYVSQHGLEEVEAPKERSAREVEERLAELAEESDAILAVYQQRNLYPQKLLEALANNPEMADFAEGYLTSGNAVSGGLTDYEKSQSFPLFLQWDPRWGYESYGDDSCVGLAGCGPTCLSMALYYLTGNERLTPDQVADYAMDNGYYMPGTGTAWALLEDMPPLYGVNVREVDNSQAAMEENLGRGRILIVSVGRGDFTVNGHFIVVYGYDESGFWVNDPNCVARSRSPWSYDRIAGQIKCIWSLG